MGERNLLNVLLDEEGYADSYSFAEDFVLDSVVPGICRECHGVMDCEPDARNNWCDECGKDTVVSGLVLMGLI